MGNTSLTRPSILRYPHEEDKFGARPKDPSHPLAEVPVHDYGHVALVSVYGSDELIVDAAQVSYGRTLNKTQEQQPKRTIGEIRRLIRYLLRHKHTSPFEQAEVTYYLRLPIFVCRQLIRHRTANVNEYSARYSELSDDYYLPSASYLGKQSLSNKQGREMSTLTTDELAEATNLLVEAQETSTRTYKRLLEMGVSRELARIPISVGAYTEMYWKCDLHNLMHLLTLRTDSHAQQESQDYANAMLACLEPFFPLSLKAWRDYAQNAYTLSASEIEMLGTALRTLGAADPTYLWPNKPAEMSEREYHAFRFFLDSILVSER